jgi:lipoyl(octanoyl) transferase
LPAVRPMNWSGSSSIRRSTRPGPAPRPTISLRQTGSRCTKPDAAENTPITDLANAVAYVMLDLKRRRPDVRAFVSALETVIISTLESMNVNGERREDRVGVWVRRPDKPRLADGSMAEDKIAAIGIRLRKWVSFHGLALNVDPDLEHFSGIVPCGVRAHGVTSLVDLGLPIPMHEADIRLREAFETVFGPTRDDRPNS